MSDGFLGRWSRRKLETSQGKVAPAEPPVEEVVAETVSAADASALAPVPCEPSPPAGELAEHAPELPPPTLDDVRALTAESDFSRFAARDVAPEVKNAALKKLFADPHYNVMDGLDVYIDDYSKPDPLPTHIARQLAGAAFLRLFEETPPQEGSGPREVADNPTAQSVAQSVTAPAVPAPPPDADPDLRLQQDDAAEGGTPGPGTA
jgi:hypothetical protein